MRPYQCDCHQRPQSIIPEHSFHNPLPDVAVEGCVALPIWPIPGKRKVPCAAHREVGSHFVNSSLTCGCDLGIPRHGSHAGHGSHVGGFRDHSHRRSEEHTSELQSHLNLVCRLLLAKKKTAT